MTPNAESLTNLTQQSLSPRERRIRAIMESLGTLYSQLGRRICRRHLRLHAEHWYLFSRARVSLIEQFLREVLLTLDD